MQYFYYKEKGLFLQKINSYVSLVFIATLLIMSLLINHPLFLTGLLVVIIYTIRAADGLAAWESYMKYAIWIALFIVVINPLINQSGKTLLWHGPYLPLLGHLKITAESLAYGAAMGVCIICVISVFCLFNLIIHPDRLLNLVSRIAQKSALVVALATRLFPAMALSITSIKEVQQLRGLNFSSGSLKERAVKFSSLFYVLLNSSLESSLQIAEAMQARAFGSGPRSSYSREVFRPRDWICLAGILVSFSFGVYSLARGHGSYSYFPELGGLYIDSLTVPILAVMLGGLLIPAWLNWGWQKSQYLKQKI